MYVMESLGAKFGLSSFRETIPNQGRSIGAHSSTKLPLSRATAKLAPAQMVMFPRLWITWDDLGL